MEIKTDHKVEIVFNNYPVHVRKKLSYLRELVLETSKETEGIDQLEETLKWGEPSYLAKKGSTIRIDWKEKTPDQYAMYFKCTSKLVPTFKMKFGDLFKYEGDRAIVFQLEEKIPVNELKKCVSLGLQYHKIMHLPNLVI
jgi:hypothetical protein